jgi:hypothetical protein
MIKPETTLGEIQQRVAMLTRVLTLAALPKEPRYIEDRQIVLSIADFVDAMARSVEGNVQVKHRMLGDFASPKDYIDTLLRLQDIDAIQSVTSLAPAN